VILNNAEVRAIGGMPGSVAEITAEDGKLTMGDQGSATKVRALKEPVVDITEEEQILYSRSIAMDMRQTGRVPDFPRTAELLAEVVGKRWKTKYDGVVAVDPIAMSYVLGGIGPVNAGDGVTLNRQNAVATLLNGVYEKYPIDVNKQDDVFETAARRIFDATVAGTGDSVAVIRALVRGASERRVMLWARDEGEQRRLQRSGVANALDQRGGPQVNVFVNDIAGSKMEFFLDMGTSVRSKQCLDGDTQELVTTTTLTSVAPQGQALSLSVTGLGRAAPRGNMLLEVTIVGPRRGEIDSMTVDGQQAPVGGAELNGRPVAKVARELPPGKNSVIITRMKTASATPGDPQLRTTSGVRPNADSVTASSC